jgi:hypothetical protein
MEQTQHEHAHLVDPGTLDAAQLEALLARYDGGIDWQAPALRTYAGLQPLLQYLFALSYAGRNEQAVSVAAHIRHCIEEAFEAHPGSEEMLDCLITLNQLSGRFFAIFERDHFQDFDYYHPVIRFTEGLGHRFLVENTRAKLSLLQGYDAWQKQGGEVAALPAEQADLLQHLQAEYLPALPARIEAEGAAGNLRAAADMKRALGAYYFQMNQPNDAVRLRKELLAMLPTLPDAHLAEQAEVNVEIGSILAHYKKYKGALPYFEAAHQLYLQAGDEFEPLALQAESLADDCRAHL